MEILWIYWVNNILLKWLFYIFNRATRKCRIPYAACIIGRSCSRGRGAWERSPEGGSLGMNTWSPSWSLLTHSCSQEARDDDLNGQNLSSTDGQTLLSIERWVEVMEHAYKTMSPCLLHGTLSLPLTWWNHQKGLQLSAAVRKVHSILVRRA